VKAHGVIACAIYTEEFKNPKSAYKHLKSQHFSIIIESKKTNILPCIEEANLLDAQNVDNTIVVFGDSVIGSGDAIADLQRLEDIGADLLSRGDAIYVPECFVSQANDLGDRCIHNDIDITEVVVASNKSIEPECDVPYYDIDEELEQSPPHRNLFHWKTTCPFVLYHIRFKSQKAIDHWLQMKVRLMTLF
jgi:hypothetical protein